MAVHKFKKICLICGDKAIGNNFNALTCESCKAFFRRHANKDFNCHYGDNCTIDIMTRRLCKKCRLKKCFEIGMKKDWILSEEEREERKLKIELNRIKRKSSHSSKSNDSSDTNSPENANTDTLFQNENSSNSSEIIDFETINNTLLENPEILNLDLDFDIEDINTGIVEIENFIENNGFSDTVCQLTTTPLETLRNKSETIGLVLDSDEINRQIDNYIEVETNEIPISVYQKAVELEFSVIPIARPLTDYRNNFNELEGNKLTELLNAMNILTINNTNSPIVGSKEDTMRAVSMKLEQDANKMVYMCKNLTAFKSICADDQIILIRYGIIELNFLRSIETYDPQNQCFSLILDNENSVLLTLDVIKLFPFDMYGTYKSFLQKILPEWDSDAVILNLLTAIVLFNPERPDLKHRELVKLQQHIYMHLLQRYLLLKCRTECEAKQKFLRLLNSMIDLDILSKKNMKKYSLKAPEYISPLLREILGIKLKPIENYSQKNICVH